MALLIFFAATAIGISFLCSVMEAALLSIIPSYIAQLEEKNPKLFREISRLKSNIDEPLAAILTLNTVAHTVGAAGVGAQVAAMYGQAYLGLASGIMTLAILVLSEILPKSIGARYWKQLIPSMVITLKIMIWTLKPFLYLSRFIPNWFNKVDETSSIRDEIKALAKMGNACQVLDDNKYRVICNVVNLYQIRVKDIMTPRIVVHSVKPNMSMKSFAKFVATSPFSRFPIIDEEKQIFAGYIHKGCIVKAKENEKVDNYVRAMSSVYSEARLENVLAGMLEDRTHMALVIDQHGTWVGIITLEDIIETILGREIIDEFDEIADMQQYAKMKWKKKLDRKKETAKA